MLGTAAATAIPAQYTVSDVLPSDTVLTTGCGRTSSGNKARQGREAPVPADLVDLKSFHRRERKRPLFEHQCRQWVSKSMKAAVVAAVNRLLSGLIHQEVHRYLRVTDAGVAATLMAPKPFCC